MVDVLPIGLETAHNSGASVTCAVHADTEPGDLIIGVWSGTSTLDPSEMADIGFSLIRASFLWESRSLEMWWRYAPDPVPSDYTFVGNTAASAVVILRSYRDIHPTDPIGDSSVVHAGLPPAGDTVTMTSITTTANNALLLGAVGGMDVTWTPPASMLPELWDLRETVGSVTGSAGAEEPWPTPGATGTRVWTASGSTGRAGILVEIQPRLCDPVIPDPLFIPHKARLLHLARDFTDDGIERAISEQFDNLKEIERWAMAYMRDTLDPDRCLLHIPHKDHSARDWSASARESFDNLKAIERWAGYLLDGTCGCSCFPVPPERLGDKCQLFIPHKAHLLPVTDPTDLTSLRIAAEHEFDNYKTIERWANRYASGECVCTG